MYIIISVILLILSILFAIVPWTKKIRRKYTELFSFLFALVAIFVGVFLAIELTTSNEQSKEKNNVIKLLNASSLEISNKILRTQAVLSYASIPSDSENYVKQCIKSNPIQLPSLFLTIISNESVLRLLTQEGIKVYYNTAVDLKIMNSALNDGVGYNDTILLRTTKRYLKLLEFTQVILQIEIEHLEGIIPDDHIKSNYEKFSYDCYAIPDSELDTAYSKQVLLDIENY